MAITGETTRLIEETRRMVELLVDGLTRSLAAAWLRAWEALAQRFAGALEELAALGGDHWPTRAQIQRAPQSQETLDTTHASLVLLAAQALTGITAAAKTAIDLGAAGTAALILSQLPAGNPREFQAAPGNLVTALINRTAQQIHTATKPLPAYAVEAMRRELIRGPATGADPSDITRQMLARVEGEFHSGLTRALNIARTEIADAHRAAAMLAQAANADVLAGWRWTAQLGTGTCPSCWAMDGTVYPLAEPGPLDHQSGRCRRVPVTKSWREIGFAGPEPPSTLPDAQETFWALPRADQLHIMGPGRLDLLERGEIAWSDLSTLRQTPGWRPSYAVTPVRDLIRT